MRKRVAVISVTGSILAGGAVGAAFFGPLGAGAATTPPTVAPLGHFGGPGGQVEAGSDAAVVAKAIGIGEADLRTALESGQSIAAVAKAHGVAASTVVAALVADGQSELDAAVKSGRLTQAQADAMKPSLTERATARVNGTFEGHRFGGPRRGFDGPGGRVAMGLPVAVAKTIGISEAELRTALESGQSIAAVAKAHGVAASTVVAVLVADGQSELDAAVKSGRLTQAQADALKPTLTERATAQVNGTFETHRFGGPGGHVEAGSDAAVVAKAIGIGEADLRTALESGQSIAAVAKAHGVAASTVVAALVADGQSELDAAVKSGRLTQAQADAMKPSLTERATAQVNGTFETHRFGGPPPDGSGVVPAPAPGGLGDAGPGPLSAQPA